jgi:hypothetical protein
MNIKSLVAAAGLCLSPLCGQAGVVYQWTATNDETPRGIMLSMEFDNRTVRSGAFNINIVDEPGLEVPRSGLLGLRYTFPGMENEMVYTSRGGAGFSFGRGNLLLNLQFDATGYLTGSIFASDSNSDIRLASIGRTFTVINANSDEGMPGAGCPPRPQEYICGGATGTIQRVVHNEVPEPTSIALTGAGLFAASMFRRRKIAS